MRLAIASAAADSAAATANPDFRESPFLSRAGGLGASHYGRWLARLAVASAEWPAAVAPRGTGTAVRRMGIRRTGRQPSGESAIGGTQNPESQTRKRSEPCQLHPP